MITVVFGVFSIAGWCTAWLLCLMLLRDNRKHGDSLREWGAVLRDWGSELEKWQEQIEKWSDVNDRSIKLLAQYSKWFGGLSDD